MSHSSSSIAADLANTSVFVHLRPDQLDQSSSQSTTLDNNNNFWLFEHARRENHQPDTIAFLLLSGFGPNPSVLTKFVRKHLLRAILDSVQFEQIVSQLLNGQKKGKGTQTQRTEGEEQLCKFLREVFVQIDADAYEAVCERLFQNEGGEGQMGSQLLESGCTAILALFIGSRLVLASLGEHLTLLCKDGPNELTPIRISECQQKQKSSSFPSHCFGDFARKTDGQAEEVPSAEPELLTKIELDQNCRFLMFPSQSVWRLFQYVHPESQALDSLVANALAEAFYSGEDPQSSIHSLLTNLVNQSSMVEMSPNDEPLSVVIVDLSSELFEKTDFLADEDCEGREREEEGEEEDEQSLESRAANKTVRSEVDWSEFYTHHLKDEVLAKIDSLRQLYSERAGTEQLDGKRAKREEKRREF